MQTSNLIAYAVPIFTFMILCEFIYGYLRNKNNYRLNDTFTSIGLGLMSRYPTLLRFGVQFLVYKFIWDQNFHLGILDSYSPFVWVTAFIVYDISYYWMHRCSHEIKFLWATHVVHHHGEEFNLSTALRQTSTDFLFKWVFYTPILFLGVPPEIFATVAGVNLIYQFWVHTEHIGRLGILDYIFVTPSNHRIHHAQNKEYIDANYGGVFILWDRIFGTFIDERSDLKPVYGTSKPLKSWNPLWANLEVWVQIFKDTWRTERWSDKVKVWTSPPGWRPDDVAEKYPIEKNDLDNFNKYDTKTNLFSKLFGFGQLVFVSIYTQAVLFNPDSISYLDKFLIGFNIMSILVFASLFYENKFFAYYLEFFRALSVVVLVYLGNLNFVQEMILGHAIIAGILSGYAILTRKNENVNEAHEAS